MFSLSSLASEIDIIHKVLEEGKTAAEQKMNSGLRIQGEISFINQHFDQPGWSRFFTMSGMTMPMLRKDAEILEEFASGNRYHTTVSKVVRNARSIKLEDINNPDNSFTSSHRSIGFRDANVNGACVVYEDEDKVMPYWVIEPRKDNKTYEDNDYSLLRILYDPFFDRAPFNINKMIENLNGKAEELFQTSTSQDGEQFTIQCANPIIPNSVMISLTLSSNNPEKIYSIARYYNDGSLYICRNYHYSDNSIIQSIEEFQFNEEGWVKDVNDNLREKASTYILYTYHEFTQEKNFADNYFDPYSYIVNGSKVHDRVNGIYYIEGKKDSVISLEEKMKSVIKPES